METLCWQTTRPRVVSVIFYTVLPAERIKTHARRLNNSPGFRRVARGRDKIAVEHAPETLSLGTNRKRRPK